MVNKTEPDKVTKHRLQNKRFTSSAVLLEFYQARPLDFKVPYNKFCRPSSCRHKDLSRLLKQTSTEETFKKNI